MKQKITYQLVGAGMVFGYAAGRHAAAALTG